MMLGLQTPKPTAVRLFDLNGAMVHEMTLPPGLRGSVRFQGHTFVESPEDEHEYYEVPNAA
jgi:hypothetical protein